MYTWITYTNAIRSIAMRGLAAWLGWTLLLALVLCVLPLAITWAVLFDD